MMHLKKYAMLQGICQSVRGCMQKYDVGERAIEASKRMKNVAITLHAAAVAVLR